MSSIFTLHRQKDFAVLSPEHKLKSKYKATTYDNDKVFVGGKRVIPCSATIHEFYGLHAKSANSTG